MILAITADVPVAAHVPYLALRHWSIGRLCTDACARTGSEHTVLPASRDGPVKPGHDGKEMAILTHPPVYPFAPSSSTIFSRMMNFCILPVTVIGNSSTKRICRGTL